MVGKSGKFLGKNFDFKWNFFFLKKIVERPPFLGNIEVETILPTPIGRVAPTYANGT